jgi:hypothetical protein
MVSGSMKRCYGHSDMYCVLCRLGMGCSVDLLVDAMGMVVDLLVDAMRMSRI